MRKLLTNLQKSDIIIDGYKTDVLTGGALGKVSVALFKL